MVATPIPARSAEGGYTRYRGTLRLAPPHETWRCIAPVLRLAGITRIVDYTDLDTLGMPVFGAVRPDAAYHHFALGKGITRELSRISAAMEAIEVWHAETVPAQVVASRRDLGDAVARLDLGAGRYGELPVGTPAQWLLGHRLGTGAEVAVPLDAVRLSSGGRTWRTRWAPAITNGLASGNTVPEAVLHGLFEIVERDCLAGYLREGCRGQVVLDSVADPECRELLRRYADAGCEVAVADLTNDLGVPVYAAYLRGPGSPWVYPGAGAHLNPAVALSRALTEAAQLRLVVLLGLRDDLAASALGAPRPPVPFAESPLGPPVLFPAAEADEDRSIPRDIEVLLAALDRRGADPIVVDLTRPEVGVPVVKVLDERLAFGHGFFGPTDNLPVVRR